MRIPLGSLSFTKIFKVTFLESLQDVNTIEVDNYVFERTIKELNFYVSLDNLRKIPPFTIKNTSRKFYTQYNNITERTRSVIRTLYGKQHEKLLLESYKFGSIQDEAQFCFKWLCPNSTFLTIGHSYSYCNLGNKNNSESEQQKGNCYYCFQEKNFLQENKEYRVKLKTDIVSTKTEKCRVLNKSLSCRSTNIIYVLTCKIDNKQYLGHWERNWSKDIFYINNIKKPSKKVDASSLEEINELINGYINNGEPETADQILEKLSSRDASIFYNDSTNGHNGSNLPISDHLKVLIKHLLDTPRSKIKTFIEKQQQKEKDHEKKQAKYDKLAAKPSITRTTSLDDKQIHDLKFNDLRDFFDITFVDQYSPKAFDDWKDWLQPEIEL